MGNQFSHYTNTSLLTLSSSDYQVSKLDAEEMQDLIKELAKRLQEEFFILEGLRK